MVSSLHFRLMTAIRKKMRVIFFLTLIFPFSSGRTFKVFHNTLDPSVFGTTGGLRLNETGDGYVTALTMCIRFQGQNSKKLSTSNYLLT